MITAKATNLAMLIKKANNSIYKPRCQVPLDFIGVFSSSVFNLIISTHG